MANIFKRMLTYLTDILFQFSCNSRYKFTKLSLFLLRDMKNPFMKNVSVVVSGSIISQVINVAFSPLITRFFDPDSFGALGVFLSIVYILTSLAQLSYPYAVTLPKNDRDSILLMQFTVFFGTIFSLMIASVILFFRESIATALSLDSFYRYLYLIPISLFFTILISTYDHWLIRKKLFKHQSIISIAKALLKDVTLVGMALFYPPFSSLIGITIFAQGSQALAFILSARKSLQTVIKKDSDPIKLFSKSTLKLINDYRDFPFYRTPQILINRLSSNLPILILTIMSGPIAAGLFTLCYRVVKMPSFIIGNGFSNVFEQKVAETGQSGKPIQPILLKATFLLLFIGVIPFGILFLFGPSLFSIVFGNEWQTAGEYARWLSIYLLFDFLIIPSVMTVPLINLQKELLNYEIISLLTKASSLLVGFTLFNNDISAIIFFSITGAVLSIFLILYVLFTSKKITRYTYKNQ